MIKVIIPTQPEFKKYFYILHDMYQKNQLTIGDTNSFLFIVSNTWYYGFVKDGVVIGAIYFFKDGDKLFLNAYGRRKYFEEKIECLKMSTEWFNCDIYSEAQHRAAALCLLKAGFKRIEGNLFCFRRNT